MQNKKIILYVKIDAHVNAVYIQILTLEINKTYLKSNPKQKLKYDTYDLIVAPIIFFVKKKSNN